MKDQHNNGFGAVIPTGSDAPCPSERLVIEEVQRDQLTEKEAKWITIPSSVESKDPQPDGPSSEAESLLEYQSYLCGGWAA